MAREFPRVFHPDGLVRALMVIAFLEGIQLFLLRKQRASRRSADRLLERQVHALVPAVLLRAAGLDALDGDAETQPPHR